MGAIKIGAHSFRACAVQDALAGKNSLPGIGIVILFAGSFIFGVWAKVKNVRCLRIVPFIAKQIRTGNGIYSLLISGVGLAPPGKSCGVSTLPDGRGVQAVWFSFQLLLRRHSQKK